MKLDPKLRDILKRLRAGEISAEQAELEIGAPAKRGRPRKRSIVLCLGGSPPINPRYRRKFSIRELTIGKHYVGQIDRGIKPKRAIWSTIKKFGTEKSPLSESSVNRFAGAYREERRRLAESDELFNQVKTRLEEMSALSVMQKLMKQHRDEIDEKIRLINKLHNEVPGE